MRVSVYFNLHKKLWSVRADEGPEKGRVVAHAEHVALRNARGKVSAAGRAKVLREGRKNVHAFMRGELAGLYGIRWAKIDVVTAALEDWQMMAPVCLVGDWREPVRKITYNPYKYETFVYEARKSDSTMVPQEYCGSKWAVLGSYLGPDFELNVRTVMVKG